MGRPAGFSTFRNDLQGLRAIAVAVVVLCHAGIPGFTGGFVGVDLFFVLSGFLITGLLVQELQQSGGIRYARFVARRLRRLLPALLVAVFGILLLNGLIGSNGAAGSLPASTIPAITWTSNLYFAFRDTGYFDALASNDLLLHTWSLGVEEQFYLVWPWLVLGLALMPGSRNRNRLATSAGLLVGLGIVAGASIAAELYWTATEPQYAFYLMPARAWQFALGGITWIVSARLAASSSAARFSRLAGTAGLLLVVATVLLLPVDQPYPGILALAPSVGAAMIIGCGSVERSGPLARGLSLPPLVWLGDRSYSIYLWHWPLLVLLVPVGAPAGSAASIVAVAAAVGTTIVCADLSYRFVENPFRFGRLSRLVPARAIMSSMLAMAVAVAAVVSLRPAPQYLPTPVADATNYDPRLDGPGIYGPGSVCDTGHYSDEVVPCAQGPADAPYTAVLFGDSVGAQWLSALPEIYPAPGWQVIVITKSACPPVDQDYYYERIGKVYATCTTWREAAVEEIRRLGPDVLFLGSSLNYDFSPGQWTSGTERILEKLASAAGRIAILAPTPYLGFDGPRCANSDPGLVERLLGNPGSRCTRSLAEAGANDVLPYLQDAAGSYPDVAVLNLNEIVCPDETCAARTDDGVFVFRDDKHLTDSFVRLRVNEIAGRLTIAGLDPASLTTRTQLAEAE